jgi:hypothetical protein
VGKKGKHMDSLWLQVMLGISGVCNIILTAFLVFQHHAFKASVRLIEISIERNNELMERVFFLIERERAQWNDKK